MSTNSTAAIVAHALRHGPLSRAELARALRLSPPSLSRLVRPLMDEGLMCDRQMEISRSGKGRPTQLLDVAVSESLFIGVNIGADVLSGVLTNARAEIVASLARTLTENEPTHLGESISMIVADLTDAACAITVGEKEARSAMPRVESITVSARGGIVDGRGTSVRNGGYGHSCGGTGLDVLEHVRTSFPIVPCIVDEMDAVVLLEQWFGVGLKAERFAMVTVDEHVGSRVVLNGGPHAQLLNSPGDQWPSGSPSEAIAQRGSTGHLPIAGAVGICQYGHVGCATGALASASVLARARSGRLLMGTSSSENRPFNITDLMYLADLGDEPCRRALLEFGASLANYVTMVGRATEVLDVVLDGKGLMPLSSHWAEETFRETLRNFDVPGVTELEIVNHSGEVERKAQGAATRGIINWLEAMTLT